MRVLAIFCLFFLPQRTQAASGSTGKARLLTNNTEAFGVRWRMLSNARKSVYMQYYIVDADAYGLPLLGQLLQLAKQGVDVNIMVDGRGSKQLATTNIKYLQALAANGAKVVVYNPLSVFRLAQIFGANHDKIFSVDGLENVMGGRNVAEENFANTKNANQDVDVAVQSADIAAACQEAFAVEVKNSVNQVVVNDLSDSVLARVERDMLTAKYKMQISDMIAPYFGENIYTGAHESEVRVLDSTSRVSPTQSNAIKTELIELIRQAKSEIILQNAYVALSDDIVTELKQAAGRGVKISLHTNSAQSSGGRVVPQTFFEAQWQELLTVVPSMQIFTAGNTDSHLHSKVFVFDGETAVVGSYNLDQLSENVNSEIVLRIDSADIAGRMRTSVLSDIQSADTIEFKMTKDGNNHRVFTGPERTACSLLYKAQQSFLFPIIKWLKPII